MNVRKKVFSGKGRVLIREFTAFSYGSAERKTALIGEAGGGCDLTGGTLRRGVGSEPLLTETGVEYPTLAIDAGRLFVLKEKGNGYSKRLGALSGEGLWFFYNEANKNFVLQHNFGCRTECILTHDENEDTRLMFFNETGTYWYANGGTLTLLTKDKALPIACTFKGRVFFAIDPHTVAFSSPYEPLVFKESLNDGGRIVVFSEKGRISGLVPFKDAVYVLFEHGIARLSGQGRAQEFAVEWIAYGGGRIYDDSAGVCSVDSEKMFFLAEDGVYAFDGNSVWRVCRELPIKPSKQSRCTHVEGNGKYYLGFTDENGERRGLVVDGEEETGYYTFPFMTLFEYDGKPAVDRNGQASAFKQDMEGVFTARNTDFGAWGNKHLRRLRFQGEGAFELVVRSGKRERRFSLTCEGGFAEAAPRLYGEKFDVEIQPARGAALRSMKAELVTVGYSGERFSVLKRTGR